jgi:LacI family transcriptional regulator
MDKQAGRSNGEGGQRARIVDIALQAGVSTATVDRVLNSRPGVRQKTIGKVHEAMRSLERAPQRRPTVVPSIAADLVFDVVIAGGAGFANDVLSDEIARVAKARGVHLRNAFPPRMNQTALHEALMACLENRSTGVIVQPLEYPTVREAIRRLAEAGIAVVCILTDLPGADAIGYVGLDNRAAGRTAGLLMGRLCRRPGRIAMFWGGHYYRSHEEREIGFRTILREEFPELTLLEAFEGLDDPEMLYPLAREVLAEHEDLVGIYNVGGGNRGIEKAMVESGRGDEITYIAYNLTPLTRQALLTGVVDAIIHQDMGNAATQAIGALLDRSARRPVEIARIPVEIIMRENVR